MTLGVRALLHWLRRSHWPAFVRLGPFLKCEKCDFGTPTGSSIRPTWALELFA